MGVEYLESTLPGVQPARHTVDRQEGRWENSTWSTARITDIGWMSRQVGVEYLESTVPGVQP